MRDHKLIWRQIQQNYCRILSVTLGIVYFFIFKGIKVFSDAFYLSPLVKHCRCDSWSFTSLL